MDRPKQVIIVRTDLGMRKGKMIAQGAHASFAVVLNEMIEECDSDGLVTWTLETSEKSALGRWLARLEGDSFKKICCRIDSEEELVQIYESAKEAGLLAVLIEDAGLTEFNGVKTKTCCAIGPDDPSAIDKITGHLKLL